MNNKVAKTIIAVGGGEIRLNETFAIDEYIVKSTGKKNPKALFIPTASGEPDGYTEAFNRVYGSELGCIVNTLKILTETPTDHEIQDMIFSADIIYVGGGNTAKMMDAWKNRGIDNYLWQAYDKGVILSGLSAGSICWFEHGHSDSFIDETGEFSLINGLGMIPGFHCPHYNERPDFDEFMKRHSKPAIAIEDNCAVVFQNDAYKVIKSLDSANAYLIYTKNETIQKRILSNTEFQPVKSLFHLD